MWPFSKNVRLDRQLEQLKPAGIVPNPGVKETDFFSFETKVELESKPFRGLVEALAREIEREPFTPIADSIWLCDFERIEDRGAYRDVLLRLELMTGHALGLNKVEDNIDIEEEHASVSFTFRSDRVRWDLNVDDDWLDPQILVKYDALLGRAAPGTRIYSNHTDYGQSALLGAFTKEQKRVFDKLTGINMPPIASQTVPTR